MGVVSSPALVLVTVLVLVSGVCGEFNGFDGRPRPAGMDDAPTRTLGAKPAATYLDKPAACIWYAWENINYHPTDTGNCSALLWDAMSTDPALTGFMYYVNEDFYAPDVQEYLCAIGCFNLTASGPSAPPTVPPPAMPPVVAPPPVEEASPPAIPPTVAPATPPASTAVPPTATESPSPTTATPPLVEPPPPATLFRPPPPNVALPPTITGAPTDGPASSTSGASALRVFPALIAAAAVLGFAI